MKSKETLWFIGKCLSLASHPKRASEIQYTLQSGKVNWNSLVYHSSNQLVLPALYLNLERNNLLAYLPEDLVAHFNDITKQNRTRNDAILSQINKINLLLESYNIQPIYLKGSAHLLDGLYQDVAERMLSDIDFIIDEKSAKKAWQILKDNGYIEHNDIGIIAIGEYRHLTGLIKKNEVSAVEIHTRILEGDHYQKLNFSHIRGETKKISNCDFFVPSNKHQILHNILNAQKNDNAKTMHKVLLRNSYDLMLLAQKENPLKVIKEFGYYFEDMNPYIGLSAELLGNPNGLVFENTKKTLRYIQRVKIIWKYPGMANFIGKTNFIFFRIYRYISQFLLFFVKSSVRKSIIKSLSNPAYYKAHLRLYKKWFL